MERSVYIKISDLKMHASILLRDRAMDGNLKSLNLN